MRGVLALLLLLGTVCFSEDAQATPDARPSLAEAMEEASGMPAVSANLESARYPAESRHPPDAGLDKDHVCFVAAETCGYPVIRYAQYATQSLDVLSVHTTCAHVFLCWHHRRSKLECCESEDPYRDGSTPSRGEMLMPSLPGITVGRCQMSFIPLVTAISANILSYASFSLYW
jgi:hypothetical protein